MTNETLNGVLHYEKLESGVMKLDKKKQSVGPLIRDAITPFNIPVVNMYGLSAKPLYISYIMIGSSSGSGANNY